MGPDAPIPVSATATPDASTPAPAPSPSPADTLAQTWAAVCALAAGHAPTMWVREMLLYKLDAHAAVIAPQPGWRDMAKFAATHVGKEQLASLLKQVLGHPVRVEVLLQTPAPMTPNPLAQTESRALGPDLSTEKSPADHPVNQTPSQTTPPHPALKGTASAAGSPPRVPPQPAVPRPAQVTPTQAAPPGGASLNRQEARRLPLVQQVIDIFEAAIVDVRPESAQGATDSARRPASTNMTSSTPGGDLSNPAGRGGGFPADASGGAFRGDAGGDAGGEESPFLEEMDDPERQ